MYRFGTAMVPGASIGFSLASGFTAAPFANDPGCGRDAPVWSVPTGIDTEVDGERDVLVLLLPLPRLLLSASGFLEGGGNVAERMGGGSMSSEGD